MKEIARLGLILMLICAVAAGSLSYVNGITSAIIADREEKEKIAQMQKLFPDVATLEDKTVDGMTATIGLDGAGKMVGLLAEARTEGYAGTIRFTLAVDGSGKIVGVNILSQSETPGLGDKIKEPAFLSQFVGKTGKDPITAGQDIDILAGATVSTRAMASGVKKALAEILVRFMGAEAPKQPTFNPSALKDGKYTGTADGFKSDIKVEVTIVGGKITEIKVLEHNDTANFFKMAEEEVIPRIINKQSVEVDAASGATGSSKGIMQAVLNALAK